ncbi:DUF3093 domain-containing protein [Nocardioides pantholopis]|uniref:DUF3093 domain-containing protein n=1 Tax=Nocardioides pantholopis TaxID=2483798 RepID=UPI001F14DF3D|nr:DUF3093 domain-containing protein [Nocardioides pantholopis]
MHHPVDTPPGPPAYSERLGVPLRWWVQGFMFTASLWLAVVVALPGALAWGITAVVALLVVGAFIAYGAPQITVADGTLTAGRARIEARHLGRVTALDAEETRLTAGRHADVRAYLLLRPYLKRSVKVEVVDPADPTPYWLLSTRHPDQLASALSALTGLNGASQAG